jgi:hypothetical protein
MKIFFVFTLWSSHRRTLEKQTRSNCTKYCFFLDKINIKIVSCSLYVLRLLLRCCFEAYRLSISLIIPWTKPSVFPATGWPNNNNKSEIVLCKIRWNTYYIYWQLIGQIQLQVIDRVMMMVKQVDHLDIAWE